MSRRAGWAAVAVYLLAFAASGCGDREAASTRTSTQARAATAEPRTVVPVSQMRRMTAKQIRELVEQHRGKVVVVNFWATWCPPCVREFPALIQVYEQYRDRGLEMFAVALNSTEELEDIEPFLQTHKPPFAIHLGDAEDETFNEDVLEGWFGEMPLTLVFNTAGERVAVHKAEITYEELSSKVEPLLPRE